MIEILLVVLGIVVGVLGTGISAAFYNWPNKMTEWCAKMIEAIARWVGKAFDSVGDWLYGLSLKLRDKY